MLVMMKWRRDCGMGDESRKHTGGLFHTNLGRGSADEGRREQESLRQATHDGRFGGCLVVGWDLRFTLVETRRVVNPWLCRGVYESPNVRI